MREDTRPPGILSATLTDADWATAIQKMKDAGIETAPMGPFPPECDVCDHPWGDHFVDFSGSDGCRGYLCQCNGYNVTMDFGYVYCAPFSEETS